MGSDLQNKTTTLEVNDLERVENGREVLSLELDIDDGTNDGLDRANVGLGLSRVGAGFADEHG